MKGFVVGFLLIIGLVLLCLGAYTLGWADDNYKGKEIFQTETDYANFKNIVGQDNIYITDILELSSAPPIVVDFNISVPHNYPFPYGNLQSPHLEGFVVVGLGVVSLGFGISVAVTKA